MKSLVILCLCMILLSGVGYVLAHGSIALTDPMDGAQLDAAPSLIQVWFSEELVPNTGQISMINGDGEVITLPPAYHSPDDPTLVLAEPPSELAQGAYIVTASGEVASDGHIAEGSFVFWVGDKTLITSTSAEVSPAYWIIGLFGGITLFSLAGLWWWNKQESPLAIDPPIPFNRPSSDL